VEVRRDVRQTAKGYSGNASPGSGARKKAPDTLMESAPGADVSYLRLASRA